MADQQQQQSLQQQPLPASQPIQQQSMSVAGSSFSSSMHDKVHKSPQQGSHPAITSFNPRSCVTCRRRKVKCNKSHPCSNCVKAHIDCIYPAPGRAPRRPRKPPDAELLARLRRLEGVVQTLGVPVDGEEGTPSGVGSPTVEAHRERARWSPSSTPSTTTLEGRTARLGNDFGRLVINEGRSRYVNNPVWATLSSEVHDLKGILDESSEEDSSYPSPTSTDQMASPPRDAFIFGTNQGLTDLTSVQPPTDLIMEYWAVYRERCHPVLNMLHIPTMTETVQQMVANGGKASKGIEALMFAVYLASITSLPPEECIQKFGDSKDSLLQKFRYGTEQALARAHFLVTEEITVLQAFVLLLVCLRRIADPRAIWSLCGLACRIALTIGLHRDGTNFGISPFETEMRRRTWWQVFLLDTRSAEDHGADPSILETSFDTHFPLNVSDSELSPSMQAFPEEHVGFTEMTFCLLRYEIASGFRRFHTVTPNPGAEEDKISKLNHVSPEDRERLIEECHQRLEEKYLRHFDMNIPMQWVASTVARLVMAKQWLALYHPSQRDGLNGPSSGTLDKIFVTCVESLEYALLLQKERKAVKWDWMYRSYNQFHALVFLLSELKKRTKGPLVNRAWRAVDATVIEFGETENEERKGHLWKPLRKLLLSARLARQRQLELEHRQNQAHAMAGKQPPNFNANTSALSDRNLELLRAAQQQDQQSSMKRNSLSRSRQSSIAHTPQQAQAQPTLDFTIDPTSSNGNYVWDNISSNVPATSTFFANQPQIQPSQWIDLTQQAQGGGGRNNGMTVMQDWIADFGLHSTNGTPVGSLSNASGQGISGLRTSVSTNVTQPTSPLSGGPSSQAFGTFTGSPSPSMNGGRKVSVGTFGGGQPAGGASGVGSPSGNAAFVDPMVSGSEDGNMQWADWDEMMREFDMGTGNTNQWGRRPVMGETWL